MLDDALTAQLEAYLKNIVHPIELIASIDDGKKSVELVELLEQIAGLSDQVSVSTAGTDTRRPSFIIRRVGTDIEVAFAGIPLGHEFTSLVLALLQVGGHPSKEAADLLEQVKDLDADLSFETYYSLTCQNCPDVVQALNLMAVLNPRISHVSIDGAIYSDEIESRGVMGVPTVFLNGEMFESGRMSLAEIVARLDTDADAKAAAKLSEADPYDVVVIGGGPAGAAASIYAARKGIRTGLIAERLGGQVLDTMSIENLISVPYTEGPKLASALEQHIGEYDIEVTQLQRASKLIPAREPGAMTTVEFESGAQIQARSVVLAPGARWRHMGVPGEDTYRTKGVAYCPHCDGPLYRGKRVAVIGGGNSGIEAAIDLAGIVSHVTVIEFDTQLRADEVLQRKLMSLPNVDVVLNALTTEVLGDGTKVTGLTYQDRASEQVHQLELEGIFVQIGLLPNTEWLQGSIDLTPRGEIVIDDRGQTSAPGVFAAGDATTVPYKQIVISMGAGATAALSAFDYLIRSSAPTQQEALASA